MRAQSIWPLRIGVGLSWLVSPVMGWMLAAFGWSDRADTEVAWLISATGLACCAAAILSVAAAIFERQRAVVFFALIPFALVAALLGLLAIVRQFAS